MNVTKIESRTVKTYTISVKDGEVRSQRYSDTRRYRVDRITITKQDGNVSRVELGGRILKKDGTESLNTTTESLWGHREWPEWLHGIVGGLA